ncbi:MAG: 4Fe-4S dicluster domain-containing protein [Magnetococcales bacterium]|nr:4Fe-4S dicluster domain-containing protein [Magnetococcales bacterium]
MSQQQSETVTVWYDEEPFQVPAGRTLLVALEEVGIGFIRSIGCRGGVCGACTILYRISSEHELRVGLMCQEQVEEGMRVMPLPYFPQKKARHDLEVDVDESPDYRIRRLYPEVSRCIMCGECTRLCPMEIDVMSYVGMIKSGDLKGAAKESFTCIQCQACALRCPAQISQPNAALISRRLLGRCTIPRAEHLTRTMERMEEPRLQQAFRRVRRMSEDDLRALYQRREREPNEAPPGTWLPENQSLI